jgi:phage gpG-like protein
VNANIQKMTQFKHPFHKLNKEYWSFRQKLPDIISTIAVNDFKENFRRQGYIGNSGELINWQPRKINKGKGRAILVKSGRLKRDIRKKPDYRSARAVTSVPYAQAHNEGFKGRIKVRGKKVKEHYRNANIPKRPFMITTPALINRINTRIETDLDNIFKKIKE